MFAKELQVAWLLRDLNHQPPPADLSARLTPQGIAHRNKFVATLNRIAVLTLSDSTPQRSRTRKVEGSKSSAPRPDPVVLRTHPTLDRRKAAAAIDGTLGTFAFPVLKRFLFMSPEDAYGLIAASPEQLTLCDKMDDLTRSALVCWGRRHLDFEESEDSIIDDGQFSEVDRQFRRSLIELTTSVIFAAILRPEQGAKLKRALWAKQGPGCLLDPELGSLLGIKDKQREMIQTVLGMSSQQHVNYRSAVVPFVNQTNDSSLKQQLIESIRQNRVQGNDPVWDLLTPAQISKLKQMLGDKALMAKPARGKPSPRSGSSS